jgi:hypothetical protein
MSASTDGPIPYKLTRDGWTAARATAVPVSTLTAAEAAEALGVTTAYMCRLASRGAVEAIKVDLQWLIDGASLEEYRTRAPARPVVRRRGARSRVRLSAAPLLRQIELAGGVTALGSRRRDADLALLERAAREGSLTIWAADHLAVSLLGLTLWELWPDEL